LLEFDLIFWCRPFFVSQTDCICPVIMAAGASGAASSTARAAISRQLRNLKGSALSTWMRSASTGSAFAAAATNGGATGGGRASGTRGMGGSFAAAAAVAAASLGAAVGSANSGLLTHRTSRCEADGKRQGRDPQQPPPRWMSADEARAAVLFLHNCFFDDEMEDVRLYDISEEEEAAVEISGSDSTYGEVTCELLEWAIERLPLQPQDVIIDLGSGGGRALLYLALRTGCDVVGVELSPTRHDAAEALFHLAKPLLRPGQKVQLLKGDILEPSVPQSEATVVLIANRLFSDDFTSTALKTTPNAEVLIALREVAGWTEAEGVTAQCALLPTTWMQRQPVLLLSRRK